MYENELLELMARLSSDARKAYKNRLPSNETVRLFRSKHREITIRNGQEKEKAKLMAEHPDHARICEKVLRSAVEKRPHLEKEPRTYLEYGRNPN